MADLRTSVHNHWDRGLLGLVVDRQWPTRPFVYIHYVYDAPPGEQAPTYGAPDTDSDPCPASGCVAQVRLARLTAALSASPPTVTEHKVLLGDLCHQGAYHDGGGMRMGPEGAAHVSIGEGAAQGGTDYGNHGNPCGDPPSPAGTDLTPPSAEGGSLRAQDRRTAADPASVDGAVIRIDPDTGAGWPTNPQATNADPEVRKIIAFGLRSPFRITLRPGTEEAWVGDVGSHYVEEINRVVPGVPVENFGWPCYEGDRHQPTFDSLDLTLCEQLYAATTGSPGRRYHQLLPHRTGDRGWALPVREGAITGLDFYVGGAYPAKYQGALVFVDYTRTCFGPSCRGATACPTRPRWSRSYPTSTSRSTCGPGPTATCSFWTYGTGTLRRIYWGQPGKPPVDDTERPVATIDTPSPDDTWAVGDTIGFSGHAVDSDGRTASAVRAAMVVQPPALRHRDELPSPSACRTTSGRLRLGGRRPTTSIRPASSWC